MPGPKRTVDMPYIAFPDIAVGDILPPLTKGPLTRATLAYFCGASNDHNPIHVDTDFARASGKEDVFAHGMLNMAYMGQMLTNWIPQTALISFEVKFVALVYVGDEITCSGEVREQVVINGESAFVIDLKAVDQNGGVKLTGRATVRQGQEK